MENEARKPRGKKLQKKAMSLLVGLVSIVGR